MCDFRDYIRKGHTAFAWFFWDTQVESLITLRLPCREEAQVTWGGRVQVLWRPAPAEPQGTAGTNHQMIPASRGGPRDHVAKSEPVSSFPNLQGCEGCIVICGYFNDPLQSYTRLYREYKKSRK